MIFLLFEPSKGLIIQGFLPGLLSEASFRGFFQNFFQDFFRDLFFDSRDKDFFYTGFRHPLFSKGGVFAGTGSFCTGFVLHSPI